MDIPAEQNICYQAYKLLKEDFPQLPAVKMHLHKAIPTGAGLGGGSADGAFTLVLLNRLFQLGISTEGLLFYALRLGSDCPFFIRNRPAYATGRGEQMEDIKLDLSSYDLVLVNPGIHINTRWAFSKISPVEPQNRLPDLLLQPPGSWKERVHNDFEIPVFKEYPEIMMIKEELYRQGAVFALMTGSGSTVYGIFDREATPALSFPQHYFVKIL